MDAANMQVDLSAPDDIALADRMKLGQDRIRQELRKLIIGQDEVLQQVLLTLFVGGNSPIIGVPGLAKTLLIHTLARVVDLKFNRIQFTPDLMPSDITGTDIIQEDPATGRRQMVFSPGPIFTNILLADEINRTPRKTLAALLEAMQEKHVTVWLLDVPPDSFDPPPKVDSAVVRLIPKPPEACTANADHLAQVVSAAFSQRRKMLRNTLKGLFSATQLESVNIDPSLRPEDVSVEDYIRLSHLLGKR